MLSQQALVAEEAMVRLFSGNFNYRRFVRDRTRSFLLEALRDGLYGVGELTGDDFSVRVSAMTHGFCAGYVSGVDDKYDEAYVNVDFADELLDAMAFAQSGLGDVEVPRFAFPCAYDMLVMSGHVRDSFENKGAMAGSYVLGLMAGIDDVASGGLESIFDEGGIYFTEQEFASAAVRSSLAEIRAYMDIDSISDRHGVIMSSFKLCKVIGDVCVDVDGDALFRSALSLACDSTESLLRRMYVNRSGYELRNFCNEIVVRAVPMACVMLDEMLKCLVGASGFDSTLAGKVLNQDLRNQIAFMSRFEARSLGMVEHWPQIAAYFEASAAHGDTFSRAQKLGVDPFRFAMTEAFGATMAQMHVNELGCSLSREEASAVLRAVAG